MRAEYSVEEVRAMASDLRGAPGTSMIGTHISLPTAMAVAIYEALCAFAERIAADDGAVVVAHRFLGPDGSAVTEWDDGMPDNGKVFPHLCPPVASVQYAYAHPPAQAAQVDKPPRLGCCCCGEPCTLGVVHRTDGPCFHYVEPTAEPVAQGEFDAEARSHARMIHDFPRLSAFFQKHALGSKLPASCFACGHVGERAITHAELADIYVCKTCAEKIAKSPAKSAEPSTHPTTNSPEIDSKLVGGAVAQVRHFDYRGVAGHGFSQEAQMLDGAPVLPDGTLLYTTPPAKPAELPEFLKDPANVHVMMLRGAIAIPSIRSMVDLRGEVPNGEDAQFARIAELQEQVAALEAQPAERDEMSPDFTDSARAAITWVLYHHQGGSSPIGQPLRFALGMGASERLPDWRIAEAKRWAQQTGATTDRFHQPAERMVEGKLVGYVWPGKADYDYIHRCMGKDGDPEARRIPGGAVGVYAPLTAAQDADR